MDIYATREELKSRQKNIFDLKLNVAYYARVSTDKEEQKTLTESMQTTAAAVTLPTVGKHLCRRSRC